MKRHIITAMMFMITSLTFGQERGTYSYHHEDLKKETEHTIRYASAPNRTYAEFEELDLEAIMKRYNYDPVKIKRFINEDFDPKQFGLTETEYRKVKYLIEKW